MIAVSSMLAPKEGELSSGITVRSDRKHLPLYAARAGDGLLPQSASYAFLTYPARSVGFSAAVPSHVYKGTNSHYRFGGYSMIESLLIANEGKLSRDELALVPTPAATATH